MRVWCRVGLAALLAATAVACGSSQASPERRLGGVGEPRPGTVRTTISGGYDDYPEGATPVPSAAPEAKAAARALAIPSFRVPIDRIGRYEVEVGRALLPNGVLTETSLDIDQPPFPGFELTGATVLRVHAADAPGEPLWNRYATGWQEGTLAVRAVVTFEVVAFQLGAQFELRNIVVR